MNKIPTIGLIDAHEKEQFGCGFVERVRNQIASSPDGLTRRELWDLFPSGWRNSVSESVALLIKEQEVVEVTRTHGSAQSEKDHKRLMVFKRSIN